ncbi:MAG: mechanosensitive ion channel family protein [Candidatus Omnitrophica bacterium]|nr:mechanosensitive ion channel family protein [Candidatus Omnitrophota bacterium]
MEEILNQIFLGNKVLHYAQCALIFLVAFFVIKIIKSILLARLIRWAEKTKTSFDDFLVSVIKKTGVPLAYVGAFYFSLKVLTLVPVVEKIVDYGALALVIVFITRLAILLISYSFDLYIRKQAKDTSLERSMKSILMIIKIVVWGIAIVFFLDNLGIEISAVIAGLGIGGIAVALAAQTVLGDLFSFFSILFDRPFETGDFIIVGEYLGTVEHVGIKTTRISSLGGEQIVFSNTDLTNSRVRNYKRMARRRVVFKLGVTYQTPVDKMKETPGMIESIIKKTEDTTFDRAHFFSYGDFSLVIEVVYYVETGDYNKYMDKQQEINFAIMEEFNKREIEFAYPTQTLYINKQT